ncbi:hypothetical protein ACIQ34_00890 [Ureibacillus sp. NPDC094379]
MVFIKAMKIKKKLVHERKGLHRGYEDQKEVSSRVKWSSSML